MAAAIPILWAYLTGSPGGSGGWLSWRTPKGTDRSRQRWPIRAPWREVRAADWSPCVGGATANGLLLRDAQRQATLEGLLPSFSGYLTTLASLTDEPDLGALLTRLGDMVETHLHRRGKGWDLSCAEKRRRLSVDVQPTVIAPFGPKGPPEVPHENGSVQALTGRECSGADKSEQTRTSADISGRQRTPEDRHTPTPGALPDTRLRPTAPSNARQNEPNRAKTSQNGTHANTPELRRGGHL